MMYVYDNDMEQTEIKFQTRIKFIIIGLWHGYDYKSKTDTAVPNGVDFSRT